MKRDSVADNNVKRQMLVMKRQMFVARCLVYSLEYSSYCSFDLACYMIRMGVAQRASIG